MPNRPPAEKQLDKQLDKQQSATDSLAHRIESFRLRIFEKKAVVTAILNRAESKRSEELLVHKRVRLVFALLSLLGGVVLAGDSETHSFAIIAIFFAVFGYLFVDLFEFFALPPMAAYAAMIGSAVYCVSDFVDITPDSRYGISLSLQHSATSHLVAVAQLLVLVQAILMLQAKSRRVCEQLCVFCLLELIVAAVFNNTISFGLMLIPIGIFSAWGLSLLSAAKASEQEGTASVIQAVPLSVFLTLIPAVLLFAGTFFYAIPRTTDAAQMDSRGKAMVGFSDKVRLEQFGQMLQSNDIALHVWLTDRISGKPYQVNGGFYLRGRVLENYRARVDLDRPQSDWSSLSKGAILGPHRIPKEFNSRRQSDYHFYDSVEAKVDCEASQSASLFATAPYFEVQPGQPISHQTDRWTLLRWHQDQLNFPPIKYVFGTNAFHKGNQTKMIARFARNERLDTVEHPSKWDDVSRDFPFDKDELYKREQKSKLNQDESIVNYDRHLLAFDASSMPTIKQIADSITASLPESDRHPLSIAQQFEHFFSHENQFQYSLNLNVRPQKGVDPIEQFVATDRTGHCQYYASALAMMLRSQGIPARLVVGYYSDDYNEIGNYYVARQSHAHAWVEALIDKQYLPAVVYGQPEAEQYWYRLDPTPSSTAESVAKSATHDVFDFAKTFWKSYVVDVSPQKEGRRNSESGGAAIGQIAQSRNNLAWWFETTMANLRAGDLGGGAFANKRRFSWPAAFLGVGMTLAAAIIGRFAINPRTRKRNAREPAARRSSVKFYADAIDCLAKVGINRQPSQTPIEFAKVASARLDLLQKNSPEKTTPCEPSLNLITDAFQQIRYGGNCREGVAYDKARILDALNALKKRVKAVRRSK